MEGRQDFINMDRMFNRLATQQRNLLDDGRVIGHVNAEGLAVIKEAQDEERVEVIFEQKAEQTHAYDKAGRKSPLEDVEHP